MGLMTKITESIPCIISRRTSFMTMTLLLGSFFLVEIIVGYITNSMALIADAFHMLSDVASLIVGYLALKYSTIQAPRDTYTYGYARAEVLGALVNAVFLVALCFSIFIEALKRLVILEEIENPLLVFIVGAVGLVVNIFGMFLFHQTGHGHTHGGLSHTHAHGGHGHDHHHHSHGNNQNGHNHGIHENGHSQKEKHKNSDHHGDFVNKEIPHEGIKCHSTPVNELTSTQHAFTPTLNKVEEEEEAKTKEINFPPLYSSQKNEKQEVSENNLIFNENISNANFQTTNNDINKVGHDRKDEYDHYFDANMEGDVLLPKESPLVQDESSISIPFAVDCSKDNENSSVTLDKSQIHISEDSTEAALRKEREGNEEKHEKRFPTKFRSAAALNIHAVYLHILGDALGSVIVMISAMIIIYAEGEWILYVDPTMSIIMVAIILKTSIPLLIETSKILMNSVPHHIQVNDLKKRLLTEIPQIKNVHELHIWQLAGDKIIASAHVKLTSPSEYEDVATRVKDFFHNEGIHSTTIQIEYEKDDNVGRRGECMVVCSLDSACDDMMCCKPGEE